MVRKIIICALVVFFANLFLACSSKPKPVEEPLNLVTLDYDAWTQITQGNAFPWDSTDGFYLNKEHKYGFDRYPMSKGNTIVDLDSVIEYVLDSIYERAFYTKYDRSYNTINNHEWGKNTDNIVYLSVLKGDSGKVTLKINQMPDAGSSKSYNYYICKPDYPYELIAAIDNSKKEISYTISPNENISEEIIALCKKNYVGTQKVQELHIKHYAWKEYPFYVYILGDETNKTSDRHQLLNSTNFWNLFDSVYAQAVVKHDRARLVGEFKAMGKGYVLTKANGNYKGCNYISDIDSAISKINSRVNERGTMRNIIQVGYPTKRFWPLEFDENNNIKICGTLDSTLSPILNPDKFKLELETSRCAAEVKIASATVSKKGNVWMLNDALIATKDNVDPECMVFAEAEQDNDTYVGEVKILGKKDTDAIMQTYPGPSLVVIQPWLDTATAKTALHELGHTMGLMDLRKISPSFIDNNNEENNLMIQSGPAKSLRLRQRGILSIGIQKFESINAIVPGYEFPGLEFQWGCLRGADFSCANIFGRVF